VQIKRLTRAGLPVDSEELARFLIGKFVVHDDAQGRLSGRIVESEAYLPGDEACHAFRGRTPRNGALFLRRGHAYVYIAYGTSLMLNVSSEGAGIGAGVLIRALEPLEGIAMMERRRGTGRLRDLLRGPGRLTQAMGIDMRYDGIDLCDGGALWLGTTGARRPAVACSTRIGLTRAADRLLRFYEPGNPFVSRSSGG
jgi:DNA-3-methyladenine glycosylase